MRIPSAIAGALLLAGFASGCQRAQPAAGNGPAAPASALSVHAADPREEFHIVEETRFGRERRLMTREDFEAAPAPVDIEELARVLEIRNYRAIHEDIGGQLEVDLSVFNIQRDRHLAFEIRTLFFREEGGLVDATPWTEAVAAPRRAFRYRAVASSPMARSELVQIRLPEQPAPIPGPAAP